MQRGSSLRYSFFKSVAQEIVALVDEAQGPVDNNPAKTPHIAGTNKHNTQIDWPLIELAL